MSKKTDESRMICKMEKPVIIYEEGLPLPWVHYPNLTGPFIGFSKEKNSEIIFCDCYKKAFDNYIVLKRKFIKKYGRMWYASPYREYFFDENIFACDFVRKLVDDKVSEADAPKYFNFQKGLCHKCNQKMPTVLLKFAGYNTFMQHYGWYIDLKELELGYLCNDVMLDIFPDELKEMVAEMQYYRQIWDEYASKELGDPERSRLWPQADEADKKSNKVGRRFHNIIENMVREEFGYKKVGEHWVTETALYHLVSQVLSGKKVIFHYRPDILEGLELDIFVPDLNVGIEYQGIQHYKPLEIWGGEKALERTQEHDSRKKRLCDENGIDLIYFYYSDEISEPLVRQRLKKYTG